MIDLLVFEFWVMWLNKTKSSGLKFHEQKTSPLDSISINKNRVLWARVQ